jgi:hypothetical protein
MVTRKSPTSPIPGAAQRVRKLTTLTFFLLWGCTSVLWSQEPTLYEPAEMQADLQRFSKALSIAYPGIDGAKAAELEGRVRQLMAEATVPLPAVEFHLLVMRLIAGLHDGHARAFLEGPTRTYVSSQGLLPFHVRIRDDRIFVLRDLSNTDLAVGSEILTINGMTANVILRRLEDHVGIDGASRSGLYHRLGSHYGSFYRIYPLVFGFRPGYDVAIADPASGSIREVTVTPISHGDFQRIDQERYGAALHLQSLEEELALPPLKLEIDTAAGYALLRIRRFFKNGYEEPADTYPLMYADAFRAIDEAGMTGLIIDLRGNGGGIGANAAHLVTYLSDSTFTPTLEMTFRGNDAYYLAVTDEALELDDYFGLAPSADRYVITRSDVITELQSFTPAEEHRFRGRLIVLVDGGSVSAAGMAAGLLQEYTEATLVGQETGGYAGMSNGLRQLTVRGEHTDSAINFPLTHSEFAVNRHRRSRGVVPDVPVHYSLEDIISGRDAALEKAVELLRR